MLCFNKSTGEHKAKKILLNFFSFCGSISLIMHRSIFVTFDSTFIDEVLKFISCYLK